MQERPVVVKESGGSSVAMFGILAIVVIAAVAILVWQPWNASPGHTTVIVQPGAQSGANGAASGAGSTGTGSSGGSSSSNH